jgi:hypothetical protein
VRGLAILVPALALLLGGLLGRGHWRVRADGSDRAGLRAAAVARDYARIDDYLERGGRLVDEGDTARFEAVRAEIDVTQKRRWLEHYLRHGRLHVAEADDLYFASIEAEGTPVAWGAYFELGKRHVAEADDALFAAARTDGKPDAYDLYLARGSRHVEEVRDRLRPLAELHAIKNGKLLAPLRKFLAEHRDPEVQKATRAALHERYAMVKARQAQRSGKGTQVAEVVDRVLAAAEDGKPLAIRLRQYPAPELPASDEAMVGRHRAQAVRARDHFSAPRHPGREAALAHEVLTVLSEVFHGDLVDVDSGDAAPAADRPVLDVSCKYSGDGAFEYRGSWFLLVEADCHAALRAPGEEGPAPLRFEAKLRPDRLDPVGAVNGSNVYDALMDPLPALIADKLRRLLEARSR